MGYLFGAPYMGSKTKIARDILKQLPKGERFVDLFGGGFAMSQCALLSNRYKSVWYNDINPLITDLIKRAISGEFNYKNFKPPWVTREEFDKKKDIDGYIKYCWSFGSGGKSYMFGRHIEPIKKAFHDLVVFGKRSKFFDINYPQIYKNVTADNIHDRRMQLRAFLGGVKKFKKDNGLPQLQRLERLQRMEEFTQIERLQRLENISQYIKITNISYDKYQYREGDVVYLDPPYEGTAEYDDKFDSKRFYDWCYSRPYQVWFSSYKISDKRFRVVFAKELNGTFSATNNSCLNFECLYTNK